MQQFNVLCVTFRDSVVAEATRDAIWHRDIQGKLTVETVTDVKLGVSISKTVGTFTKASGEVLKGPVLYVRTGLDSMSTTIALQVDDKRFPCVELYTDTPTTDHLQPPEEIQRMAKLTIAGRRADFYDKEAS